MKKYKKVVKLISIYTFVTILTLLAIPNLANNQLFADMPVNCSKTLCNKHTGSCEANGNMTFCGSPTGELPCTDTDNCLNP